MGCLWGLRGVDNNESYHFQRWPSEMSQHDSNLCVLLMMNLDLALVCVLLGPVAVSIDLLWDFGGV